MRRIAKLAGGSGLIVAGTALLVLPGPGLLTIAAGVALMSDEVPWAGRLADWGRDRLARARRRQGQEGG